MLDGKKVIEYMKSKGYKLYALNVVYLEDCDDEGNPSRGQLDKWDDRSLLVTQEGNILLNATATTEPGAFYTYNRMNSKGAARIAIGQHLDAWELGYHKPRHPALVQCDNIKVCRDANEDGYRSNDSIDEGMFGVNQHGCMGDGDPASIGHWSAGCLVRLYWQAHLKFIQLLKDSGRTKFSTTIIDASDLYNFKQKPSK